MKSSELVKKLALDQIPSLETIDPILNMKVYWNGYMGQYVLQEAFDNLSHVDTKT
jgi:hypothetical protein